MVVAPAAVSCRRVQADVRIVEPDESRHRPLKLEFLVTGQVPKIHHHVRGLGGVGLGSLWHKSIFSATSRFCTIWPSSFRFFSSNPLRVFIIPHKARSGFSNTAQDGAHGPASLDCEDPESQALELTIQFWPSFNMKGSCEDGGLIVCTAAGTEEWTWLIALARGKSCPPAPCAKMNWEKCRRLHASFGQTDPIMFSAANMCS